MWFLLFFAPRLYEYTSPMTTKRSAVALLFVVIGGSGWNRTNGVSNVTVLQTVAIASYAY